MSMFVGVDRSKVGPAIESLSGEIAALIKGLPDTGVRVPGADWTVGEVGAHLSDAQRIFSRLASGERVPHGDGTPGSLAHANAQLLAVNRQRDGEALAASIVDHTQNFLRNASALPASRVFDTPMGRMDADTMYAYVLTHLLMHGFQLAGAAGKGLRVGRPTAELALPFIKYALPRVVDKQAAGNLRACYQVMLRGGPKFWVTIDRGEARVYDERPRRVDCYISADPVAFLQVGFRLKSQWPMIARGKLLAWGVKPWLGFRFAGLFLPP